MLQRVYIQILDNPAEESIDPSGNIEEAEANKFLAEELKEELNHFYPYVVSVEYIDLFMDDERAFPEIRELLRHGAINTPVILINGVPKIYGGIPPAVIRKEVEKLLSTGLVH